MPRVSIITIFLNEERFLGEAVESVLAQTHVDWELLLCDDGSADRSPEIARGYARQYPDRIRYLQHPGHENRGASASRNLGINRARGNLIAFLDGDDVWFPEKLEEQVAILDNHPEVGMTYGVALYWHSWSDAPDKEDYVVNTVAHLGDIAPPPSLTLDSYPLGHGSAPCPSDLLLRREVIETVGGFEASFRGAKQLYEDQAFLAKVYLATSVYVADRTWIRYRQHPQSCVSVVHSSGRYSEVRVYFLDWMEEYLRGINFRDRRVWRALSRALWLERHPTVKGLRDKARRLRRRGTAAFQTSVASALQRLTQRVRSVRRWPPVGFVRFGNLRRVTPISSHFGFERGQPIDRYYIEAFLDQNRGDIAGCVLEIGDRTYTRRYGSYRVQQSDVLHVEKGNPEATIVADLTAADDVPSDAFDCIVCTQTLQMIFDTRAAVRTLHRILKPGGVLLLTVPGISQIDRVWASTWYWTFSVNAVEHLMREVFPAAVHVQAHGNVLASAALLYGLASEELRPRELDTHDPLYPVVITARAVKPTA